MADYPYDKDKQLLHDAKALSSAPLVRDLLDLIDRLDKQLAEVKEAGEPFTEAFDKYLSHLTGHYTDLYESAETQSRRMSLHQLRLGLAKFGRLAQALDKIEEVKNE